MSSNPTTALRNDNRRLEEAAQSIHDALESLTRASCMLGSSEGKEAVQRAHLVVLDTQRFVQNHNLINHPMAYQGGNN
jgi:hypothetical protein